MRLPRRPSWRSGSYGVKEVVEASIRSNWKLTYRSWPSSSLATNREAKPEEIACHRIEGLGCTRSGCRPSLEKAWLGKVTLRTAASDVGLRGLAYCVNLSEGSEKRRSSLYSVHHRTRPGAASLEDFRALPPQHKTSRALAAILCPISAFYLLHNA